MGFTQVLAFSPGTVRGGVSHTSCLAPKRGYLPLTLAEEKAIHALLQGCRLDLCQFRDKESTPESARGQMGLALQQSWKTWSRLALGLTSNVYSFELPSPGSVTDLVSSFQRVPTLSMLHFAFWAVKWEVELGCLQNLAVLTFFGSSIHKRSLPRVYPLSTPPSKNA